MKIFYVILAAMFTQYTLAGDYLLDCSNATGSVRLINQGRTLLINNTTFTPYINIDSLELIISNSKETSDVEITATKAPILISANKKFCDHESEKCFKNFTKIQIQSVNITAIKGTQFDTNQTTDLICQESLN